jgi:hypothetical protein
MMKLKLSDKQKEIISLMKEGWEIGQEYGYSSSAWMQEGKIGYGGKSINLKFNTVDALKDKKLICEVQRENKRLSLHCYTLTELGKTIEL